MNDEMFTRGSSTTTDGTVYYQYGADLSYKSQLKQAREELESSVLEEVEEVEEDGRLLFDPGELYD
jgi:hypothetical protein